MAFDAHKNLAISSVATPPAPPGTGLSLQLAAGDGARFPAAPFNATIWPASAPPTPANAEIVRVTARTTDALTIVRAQEGTAARAIVVGDLIAATITAKALTDVEAAITGLGTWIDVPFNAANFTAPAGSTWTVDATAAAVNRYAVIGKLMFWQLYIAWFQGISTLAGAATSTVEIVPPVPVIGGIQNVISTLVVGGAGQIGRASSAGSTVGFSKPSGAILEPGTIGIVGLTTWGLP